MNQYFDIFWRFLYLGCISFGGPAAHLGYFQRYFIEKQQWLDLPTYSRMVALSQFLPGPASSQVGFSLGYHRAGLMGAIMAFLGFTLPSFILLYLFVTKTETGTALQATAQDRQAAEILGIPSNKMFALGWAIGLSCVAVAGSMLSNFYYVFPDVGVNFSLFAFVAVALGGFGSITGSLIAGLSIEKVRLTLSNKC